jgi:hypothetical protein
MKRIAGMIFTLASLLLAPCAGVAGTIHYSVTETGEVTSAGDPVHRFTYAFSGFSLEAYQEIEIRFSPEEFIRVFNPSGGPDFDVMTLEVNNPPGASGTYSIVSMADNAPLTGIFSVDAVLTGNIPAILPYYINRLEPVTFAFLERVTSGEAAQDAAPIPEPASAGYIVIGVALAAAIRLKRRY